MDEMLVADLRASAVQVDPLVERLFALCSPSDPHSEAILSKPHPNATLKRRLITALAPKKLGLELSPFDLLLAAQYEEAHTIIRRADADSITKDRLSALHFIMQPIKDFKPPSKHPSLYELFIAYKTCLLRAVLDPSEVRDCFDMMRVGLQSMTQKRIEYEKAVALRKEVVALFRLGFEFKMFLQTDPRYR
ncbi:MAG: hypothetical protein Q9207_005760 [Kuettlingeria erythrocarpa]